MALALHQDLIGGNALAKKNLRYWKSGENIREKKANDAEGRRIGNGNPDFIYCQKMSPEIESPLNKESPRIS